VCFRPGRRQGKRRLGAQCIDPEVAAVAAERAVEYEMSFGKKQTGRRWDDQPIFTTRHDCRFASDGDAAVRDTQRCTRRSRSACRGIFASTNAAGPVARKS